eukprot:COSAG01_NODE_49683_length_370_cov_0.571956_1_plen_75_part_01
MHRAARLRGAGLIAHRSRPAPLAFNRRWVETIVGVDTPSSNLKLPFEQRVLPTTKSNFTEETVFNTYSSGDLGVR